ncbi:TetR/AcrR family transcriptional regulator [Methylobrevis pamukkalensis]|uniref:Bacterial regulatory protein, tetR family n=1 Tax=Methylobrevis pamukkalensis TaxID=1439726 RepID=A0A1E3H0I9_9HYPH|nr:TetR/AcrR family transcriptional regulator [Methylobrevis pamukkalensis]ODN69091.1 Bacterial regulatory protein, tetR family [Methylobrevis pamukkalensis]
MDEQDGAQTPDPADDDVCAGRRSIGARRSSASSEAILEAAEALLLEAGYGGFSIEAVARRARAGKPTIYRWWPSKAALLLDVYHRQKDEPAPDPAASLEDELVTFVVHLLRFWSTGASGDTFRAIVAEAQSDPEARRALKAYIDSRRQLFVERVACRKAAGTVPATLDADLVWESVIGLAWRRLLSFELAVDADRLRRLVRALLAGLAEA